MNEETVIETDKTLAEILATWAEEVQYPSLSPELVENIKSRVLDIIGICAAASALDTSRAVREYVSFLGGNPQANAVGVPLALPANLAAFANGVMAHSLDYDDTHLPSVLHPSASVIPAVLASAQAKKATGQEAIRAIAIGLEVCVRLGMAGYDSSAQNSLFFEHGQHATSICGAMGAAAGVAALHGGSDLILNSLGVAASMASGIIEANRTGGTVKRLHCGWAAHSAVTAVDLVQRGLTGPPTVLEGRFGFFQAWLHGSYDASAISRDLGRRWSVEDIFFKPYPANHFTHAAVDAAAALRRSGIKSEDINRLVLGVPAPNLRTIGEPIDVKRKPTTGYMAQFSGPYAVAAGLLGGGGLEVGLDDYSDELAQEPQRRAIMAKVEVVADDECTDIFPMQFPAVLTAFLKDGSVRVEKVLTNRGGNKNPLSFEELTRKFRDNASRIMTTEDMLSVEESCRTLDQAISVDQIFEKITEIDSQQKD